MENFFNIQIIDIIIKLSVALLLGVVLGLERVWAHKTAGMRTYALVSLGSALFVTISMLVLESYIGLTNFDPLRMAAQIIVGVGFIGTGVIFTRGDELKGLTTATGLWVAAGIGMACGFGLFNLAILATVLTLFVFVILWFVEAAIKKTKLFNSKDWDK